METSTSNAANGIANGIVALSSQEIEMVSGGKAAATTKPFWERVADWVSGLFSGSGGAMPTQVTIPPPTPADVAAIIQACASVGGHADVQYSTGSGSVLVNLFLGEGSVTTFRAQCN